jgi:hypothetical protein
LLWATVCAKGNLYLSWFQTFFNDQLFCGYRLTIPFLIKKNVMAFKFACSFFQFLIIFFSAGSLHITINGIQRHIVQQENYLLLDRYIKYIQDFIARIDSKKVQ